MIEGSRQEGRERASGKSISKEAPAALHPVLWEWEDCMTWSETLCQHPADCTAKQTRVSHRHGGEGEERKLCIPEGLCLGPAGFTTTRGPGVTDWQYESVNQTVYHAEEVPCGEAASFLCLVKSSNMHRVSSAGRSWDHSQWDHHSTHSTELSGGVGWLGSWEWLA